MHFFFSFLPLSFIIYFLSPLLSDFSVGQTRSLLAFGTLVRFTSVREPGFSAASDLIPQVFIASRTLDVSFCKTDSSLYIYIYIICMQNIITCESLDRQGLYSIIILFVHTNVDQRLNLGKNLPNDDEAVRGQLIGKGECFE